MVILWWLYDDFMESMQHPTIHSQESPLECGKPNNQLSPKSTWVNHIPLPGKGTVGFTTTATSRPRVLSSLSRPRNPSELSPASLRGRQSWSKIGRGPARVPQPIPATLKGISGIFLKKKNGLSIEGTQWICWYLLDDAWRAHNIPQSQKTLMQCMNDVYIYCISQPINWCFWSLIPNGSACKLGNFVSLQKLPLQWPIPHSKPYLQVG